MADPIIRAMPPIAATGAEILYDVGFVYDIIIGYQELAGSLTVPFWFDRTSWCGRTNCFDAHESLRDGIRAQKLPTQIIIGTDPLINAAGGTIHLVVIRINGSPLIRNLGYIGSPVAWAPKVADAALGALFVKRDSNFPPVCRMVGMPANQSDKMDGTGGISDGILAFNSDGTASIGTNQAVNQLTGTAIGEGHDAIGFLVAAGLIEVVPWTGNGAAGRNNISHTVANPVLGIPVSLANNTKGGVKISSMGTKMAHASPVELFDNAIVSMSGGKITMGSDTRYNNVSENYYMLIVGESLATEVRDEMRWPAGADPGAVFLRGVSGSYVDLGIDAGLTQATPGPGSYEVCCKLLYTPASDGGNGPYYLFALSNGDEGRADSDGLLNGAGTRRDGTWSPTIFAVSYDDLGGSDPAKAWDGIQLVIVTGDYNNYADGSSSEQSVSCRPWRTGILLVLNRDYRITLTHDGFGHWKLYVDGVLVKERFIDLRTINLGDDAGARVNGYRRSGHRAVLGARQGTASIGLSGQMVLYDVHIYDSELTAAQVYNLYQRHKLGNLDYPDVTPLRRWLAKDATNTSWPEANGNTASNGTITQGFRIMRGQL